MEGNVITSDVISIIEKRKQRAAARRRQRDSQKLNNPEKYEQAKLKNRLSTSKYDNNKRVQSVKKSDAERTVDKQLKAAFRWKQRQRKRIKYLGLTLANDEGRGIVVTEK